MMRRAVPSVVLSAALLFAAGCDEQIAIVDPVIPATAEFVAPVNGAMVGDLVPLGVRVVDDAGSPVSGAEAMFTVMDAEGAVVAERSAATNAEGIAEVAVDAGEVAGPRTVSVEIEGVDQPVEFEFDAEPGETTEIMADQDAVTLASVGDEAQLEVEATDEFGNVTDAELSFVSQNPAVASVTPDGVVTARREGITRIEVSSREAPEVITTVDVQVGAPMVADIDVSASEEVIAVGQETQIEAQPVADDGDMLPNVDVSFEVEDRTVATVDQAGVVRAQAPGKTQVTVSAGNVSVSVDVTVPNVAEVAPNPQSVTLKVGEAADVSVTVRNAAGDVVEGIRPDFVSTNPAVATVDADGNVTAQAEGTAKVMVSAGNATAEVPVTVQGNAVASVSVSPQNMTLDAIGAHAHVTATVQNAQGQTLEGKQVTFESKNPSVATVNANGQVTAKAEGTAQIVASAGGKTATTTVTVDQKVASVEVTPPATTVPVGQTMQVSAMARDANGNEIPDANVSFTSSNPSVATVDESGNVTAKAEGKATVTANSQGKQGTTTVTVTKQDENANVASVSMSPQNATMESVGAQVQMQATAMDAQGQKVQGAKVTYESKNPAVATVDEDGTVTAKSQGTAKIVAHAGGESASATVTVDQKVAGMKLDPPAATVPVGETTQMSALAQDANGFNVPDANVTFTSSDPSVATVDNTGKVTAKSAGKTTITAESEGKSASAEVTVPQG